MTLLPRRGEEPFYSTGFACWEALDTSPDDGTTRRPEPWEAQHPLGHGGVLRGGRIQPLPESRLLRGHHPPELPNPEWLDLISGLAEIALGVFGLEPRVRVLAAWGIVALLIAIFPANVYVALENVGVPSGEPGTGNAILNWLRLPFQGALIAWAWWYTRPDTE